MLWDWDEISGGKFVPMFYFRELIDSLPQRRRRRESEAGDAEQHEPWLQEDSELSCCKQVSIVDSNGSLANVLGFSLNCQEA